MPRDAILYGILFGFTQRQPIEKDTFDNVDYWYGVCLKHNWTLKRSHLVIVGHPNCPRTKF